MTFRKEDASEVVDREEGYQDIDKRPENAETSNTHRVAIKPKK